MTDGPTEETMPELDRHATASAPMEQTIHESVRRLVTLAEHAES